MNNDPGFLIVDLGEDQPPRRRIPKPQGRHVDQFPPVIDLGDDPSYAGSVSKHTPMTGGAGTEIPRIRIGDTKGQKPERPEDSPSFRPGNLADRFRELRQWVWHG